MQRAISWVREFGEFIRIAAHYVQKRGYQGWVWLEAKKDIVVSFLVTKRGIYQRPFLHSSFFSLIGVGIVIAPIIATSYPSQAAQGLENFIPPSAVLSSLDNQEFSTEESSKPRDSILIHVIVEGDTLGSLSEEFGVSIESIRWLNPDLKGDKLTVGNDLSIPPVTGIVHKVTRGETIYSIAKKYQTDAQKILNWPFNDFADLDTFALTAGQPLVVPDGVMPKAKPVYIPQLIAQVGQSAGDGQFTWPTQGVISQRPVSYHMAVDIANRDLPAILAADAGKVILVEYGRFGYGYHVIIDHNNGYQTLYGHMSDIYVSIGQAVSKGSVIGKMGSTGRSSGPHLHFEVRKGGVLLNPLGFIK
ncbi:MAG: peptidoglycan DD-metalloendopeptidase family protein [Patescibacteria group bacterium]